MNARVLVMVCIGAVVAAVIVGVALMVDSAVPAGGPADPPRARVAGAAADAGTAPPAPDETPVGQFLRTTERASIAQVVADHDPMGRGTTVRVAIEVDMIPGMHVNANPPSQDWLIPVQASIGGVDGAHVIETFYPAPKSRKFPYDDEPFLVYEGSFVIGLTLALDASMPAGGHELAVLLDYQACNDEACFAPAQTSAALPIMVVADAADAVAVSSPILDRAPFPGDTTAGR